MKKMLLIAILALLVSSCATSRVKLETLRLGMTKDQVVASIGKPYAARSAKLNPVDKKTYETWEYRHTEYDPIWLTPTHNQYFVIFRDGIVAEWKGAGDNDPRVIYNR